MMVEQAFFSMKTAWILSTVHSTPNEWWLGEQCARVCCQLRAKEVEFSVSNFPQLNFTNVYSTCWNNWTYSSSQPKYNVWLYRLYFCRNHLRLRHEQGPRDWAHSDSRPNDFQSLRMSWPPWCEIMSRLCLNYSLLPLLQVIQHCSFNLICRRFVLRPPLFD